MDSDYNIKSYNSNATTTNKALQFSRNPWGAPAAKAMFDFEWQRSLQGVAWIDQTAIHIFVCLFWLLFVVVFFFFLLFVLCSSLLLLLLLL